MALRLLFAALLIFLVPTSVLAAGFQLTHIGSMSTNYQYPEWWYSQENPTLKGTTGANQTVDITIDGTTQTVTADASGNWTANTTMALGDHTVSLNSNESTYTFTLHLGNEVPTDTGSGQSSQPVAGSVTPTLAIAGLGTLIITLGFFLNRKSYS